MGSMLMIYLCMKFNIPSKNCSLVIAIKLEVKYGVCTDITLFYILQKNELKKVGVHQIQDLHEMATVSVPLQTSAWSLCWCY